MISEIDEAIAGDKAPATGRIFKTTMKKPRNKMKYIANVIEVCDSLPHGIDTMQSGNKLQRPLSHVKDRHTWESRNNQS